MIPHQLAIKNICCCFNLLYSRVFLIGSSSEPYCLNFFFADEFWFDFLWSFCCCCCFFLLSLLVDKIKPTPQSPVVNRTARRVYATNCLHASLEYEQQQRWNDQFKCGFCNEAHTNTHLHGKAESETHAQRAAIVLFLTCWLAGWMADWLAGLLACLFACAQPKLDHSFIYYCSFSLSHPLSSAPSHSVHCFIRTTIVYTVQAHTHRPNNVLFDLRWNIVRKYHKRTQHMYTHSHINARAFRYRKFDWARVAYHRCSFDTCTRTNISFTRRWWIKSPFCCWFSSIFDTYAQ